MCCFLAQRGRWRARPFLYVALVLGLAAAVYGQRPAIRFHHLSLEEGLSQTTVNQVVQDQAGFLWIATEDGLNRYDGKEVRLYRHGPGDVTSLPSNQIWSLAVASDGRVWVGTRGGLAVWQPFAGSFARHALTSDDQNLPVRAVLPDGEGRLWVGTETAGILRYDPTTGDIWAPGKEASTLASSSVRALVGDGNGGAWIGTFGDGLFHLDAEGALLDSRRHEPADPTSLSSNQVRALHLDGAQRLWIATYDQGLDRLDPGVQDVKHFRHDPDDPRSLTSNSVTSALTDRQGTLWVGTERGLNEWRGEGRGFSHIRQRTVSPDGLATDYVLSLFQDRGDVLWVGTLGAGLSFWNPVTVTFEHYHTGVEGDRALSNDAIWAIDEEADGTIWVGTMGGLNRIDPATGSVTTFKHDSQDPTSISEDRIGSLLVDRKGDLWAGTFRGGLNRRRTGESTFEHFRHDPDDLRTLASNSIIALEHGAQPNRTWVGLFGAGLDSLDTETGIARHFRQDPNDPDSLSSDRVTVLLQTDDALWVGTDDGGINRFDPATEEFTAYRADPDVVGALASDRIWSLYQDANGLWVGTGDNGLDLLPYKDFGNPSAAFQNFGRDEGLASEMVYAILPDDAGDLWLSTNNGVFRFRHQTGEFKRYSVRHGLQSAEFNFGAHHVGSDGRLYLGGVAGLNVFRPAAVVDNRHIPQLAITSVSRNGEFRHEDVLAAQHAALELNHLDKVVTFDFAALDFTSPEENQFAYKLEGFDEDWNELGTFHRATYTSLPAGDYVLRVRASNNDGAWTEDGLSARVVVEPPPWKSWWAFCLYALAVLLAIVLAVHLVRQRLHREAEYSRRLKEEVDLRTEELAERNERLQQVSVTDALTGLRNRHYVLGFLREELTRAMRYYRRKRSDSGALVLDEPPPQTPNEGPAVPGSGDNGEAPSGLRSEDLHDFLLLMIDLDGFKPLNDTFGHDAGDAALIQVGELLRDACRDGDSAIRWGGDEFLLLIRRVERGEVAGFANRIIQMIRGHVFETADGSPVHLGCSVGCAFFPFFVDEPELLGFEDTVKIADRALYLAKEYGRGRWVAIDSKAETPRLGVRDLIAAELDPTSYDGPLRVEMGEPPPTETQSMPKLVVDEGNGPAGRPS